MMMLDWGRVGDAGKRRSRHENSPDVEEAVVEVILGTTPTGPRENPAQGEIRERNRRWMRMMDVGNDGEDG